VAVGLPVKHPAGFAKHDQLCELWPQSKLLLSGKIQISPIFLLRHLWPLLQDELHLCLCEMCLAKFSPNTFFLHNQTHHRRRLSCPVEIGRVREPGKDFPNTLLGQLGHLRGFPFFPAFPFCFALSLLNHRYAGNSPPRLGVPPQQGLAPQVAPPNTLVIKTVMEFPNKAFEDVLITMFSVHCPCHLLQQPEKLWMYAPTKENLRTCFCVAPESWWSRSGASSRASSDET